MYKFAHEYVSTCRDHTDTRSDRGTLSKYHTQILARALTYITNDATAPKGVNESQKHARGVKCIMLRNKAQSQTQKCSARSSAATMPDFMASTSRSTPLALSAQRAHDGSERDLFKIIAIVAAMLHGAYPPRSAPRQSTQHQARELHHTNGYWSPPMQTLTFALPSSLGSTCGASRTMMMSSGRTTSGRE